jgi:hypothetical protein
MQILSSIKLHPLSELRCTGCFIRHIVVISCTDSSHLIGLLLSAVQTAAFVLSVLSRKHLFFFFFFPTTDSFLRRILELDPDQLPPKRVKQRQPRGGRDF